MKPQTGQDAATGGQSGRSHSIAKRVARMLRQEIVAGDLAAGVKVAEQATAVRLGVSRVPVREALVELARGQFLLLIAATQRRLGLTTDEVRRVALVHHAEMVARIRARGAAGAERYARDVLESMVVVPAPCRERGAP